MRSPLANVSVRIPSYRAAAAWMAGFSFGPVAGVSARSSVRGVQGTSAASASSPQTLRKPPRSQLERFISCPRQTGIGREAASARPPSVLLRDLLVPDKRAAGLPPPTGIVTHLRKFLPTEKFAISCQNGKYGPHYP